MNAYFLLDEGNPNFGSYNTKGGGVDNGAKIFNASSCNHAPEIYGGIREKESAQLLQDLYCS